MPDDQFIFHLLGCLVWDSNYGLGRLQYDQKVHWSSSKVLGILVGLWWNLNLLERFSKNPQISNSIKKNPSTGSRTDRRTDMTKLVVAFRNFVNAPKKRAGCLKKLCQTYTLTASVFYPDDCGMSNEARKAIQRMSLVDEPIEYWRQWVRWKLFIQHSFSAASTVRSAREPITTCRDAQQSTSHWHRLADCPLSELCTCDGDTVGFLFLD
jgi:hypothetical protein